jgi:transposase-like protein
MSVKYSAAFKAKMVQKMLGGRSANSLSQEIEVNQPTLSKWLRNASTLAADMAATSASAPASV